MIESIIDVLLVLTIVGTAAAVGGGLIAGIIRLAEKIRDCDAVRRNREAMQAVRLYRMVEQRVPGKLTLAEYSEAVRTVIRKYDMADRSGALDIRGQNMRRVAIMLSKAVNLNRLTRGTLAIARAAAETEAENKKGETIA